MRFLESYKMCTSTKQDAKTHDYDTDLNVFDILE